MSKCQNLVGKNLWLEITFASNEVNFASIQVHVLDLGEFIFKIFERVAVIEVKAKQKSFGSWNKSIYTFVVWSLDWPEPFLSSSVPDLGLDIKVSHFIHFDLEVDSNSGDPLLSEFVCGLSCEKTGFPDSYFSTEDNFEDDLVWLGWHQ